MSGDKWLVLSSAVSKDKHWNLCKSLGPPSWLQYGCCSSSHHNFIWGKKKKNSIKGGQRMGREKKEEWVVRIVYEYIVHALFWKHESPPQAPIPSAGFYLYLIGQDCFPWPHRESNKVSLEFCQSPEWLANRRWKCLMIYQESVPATIAQTNERK